MCPHSGSQKHSSHSWAMAKQVVEHYFPITSP
ncbi:hypothetical protein T07_10407 [Trichinella nelsoni]|uniref:Uncharacterized protein n=1 Tax=Trichinella nelsoni TaxID=6336 RepID=A0A0V0RB49_9BILA|nr:hypothetical protein T07_10407 [Trichinella nelsoni]